jgi:hypothetical protein
MRERLPTSVILEGLAHEAGTGEVSLEWVIVNLRERSFGIILLLVSLIGILPGTSPVVAVLLAIPAIQMILGHAEPVLPGRVTRKRFSAVRFTRLLARVIPVLQRLERVVRPRWTTPFGTTKRVIGIVVLLLSATLMAPIPFSQIIPALVVMLLAFAFLEQDGLLLAIALTAALVSMAITAAAIWGTIEAGLLI